GVCEVRASALRPVSALIRLDLPSLERPAKATSMPAIGGSVSIDGEAQKNCQSPANSLRPCSISFASISALMRRFPVAVPHGEEALLQRRLEPSSPNGIEGSHPSRRAQARAPQDEGCVRFSTRPSSRQTSP